MGITFQHSCYLRNSRSKHTHLLRNSSLVCYLRSVCPGHTRNGGGGTSCSPLVSLPKIKHLLKVVSCDVWCVKPEKGLFIFCPYLYSLNENVRLLQSKKESKKQLEGRWALIPISFLHLPCPCLSAHVHSSLDCGCQHPRLLPPRSGHATMLSHAVHAPPTPGAWEVFVD